MNNVIIRILTWKTLKTQLLSVSVVSSRREMGIFIHHSTTQNNMATISWKSEWHLYLYCTTYKHTTQYNCTRTLSPYLPLLLGDLYSCEGDQHRHSGRHNLYNMLGESCVVVQQLIGMITQHGQDRRGCLCSHFVLALYRNYIKWLVSEKLNTII